MGSEVTSGIRRTRPSRLRRLWGHRCTCAHPPRLSGMEESEMPDAQIQAAIAYAIRRPLGQYVAERSSQLSGIPLSTLYEWRRSGTYVPDFDGSRPNAWSYRDLVFLRVLAWLRQGGMERSTAATQVRRLKTEVAEGLDIRFIHATRSELMVRPETESRTSGDSLLPFDDIFDYIRAFDLQQPIKELQRQGVGTNLWAPDLVKPSRLTAISPWVLAGDPCIQRTRIPTSAIFALREERGLDAISIKRLYPDLTVEAVQDAEQLERRLRGIESPEPVAA
jgi:uncharacterized protein (DUF433 family)